MRRIEVKNFIVLKEAIYEPKKFNVIIGPQATGKSLLVKLEYFFSKVLDEIFIHNITTDMDSNIDKIIEETLYKYFNKEIIFLYDFEISFIDEKNDIKISLKKIDSNLSIYTSKKIKELIIKLKDDYNKLIQKSSIDSFLLKHIEYLTKPKKYKLPYYQKIYIPAGRTYFSTLNESIYAFLTHNITIDPLLLEFGIQYESSQKIPIYNIDENINTKIERIINGNIRYSDKDKSLGVQSDKIFTKISFLSSGQQEILPLLVVLLNSLPLDQSFIIEEPEAHLYPTSQKELIELIAYVYNQGSSISITTHSPYIITAINNLLLLDEKKDKISKDNPLFEKLDYKISSKDLSAYTIEDGVLKNIYDKENNLIDAYAIDSVSEVLSQEYDELLEL